MRRTFAIIATCIPLLVLGCGKPAQEHMENAKDSASEAAGAAADAAKELGSAAKETTKELVEDAKDAVE